MPRSSFPAQLPKTAEKTAYVREMFDAIAPRYDLLNRIMSMGRDRSWRRHTIQLLDLAPGSIVLDLGCGTGDLAQELQIARYRAVGIDLSEQMLRRAHAGGAPLLQCDGEQLGIETGSIDGVVSGFAVRNFTHLGTVFDEIARVLRPGGRVALLEVDIPHAPVMRLGHHLWFDRVAPRLGAALSDANAYRYLPKSVVYLPDDEAMRKDLEQSGFETVEKRSLFFGTVQIVTATRLGTRILRVGKSAGDEQ